MDDSELLAEIEDLLRNTPDRATIKRDSDENYSWLGRVSAVIERWNPFKSIPLGMALKDLNSVYVQPSDEGLREIMMLLHQARHDLRMKTSGPVSAAIEKGLVFDYFDGIRKIVESANRDLYFIDPYLDAEFVSRYLGHVGDTVRIRLLAREKLKTLLPAVDAFGLQNNHSIEVRSNAGFHDRYVIVDSSSCYQSGASFKDGARSSPTTLTQITDAFPAVRQTYEDLWTNGNVER